MNFLADKSYLAVKPQSAAATPVIPNVFLPLRAESVRINPNYAADRRMKGLDWKSDELLKGSRQIEGDIEVYADPDGLAHVLNMCMAKGSTTGNGTDGYTHPFTPGEGKSYSIDIPRGNYAQRLYGVRGDQLKLSYEDNKMVATLSIKALGQFYAASLAGALTGAGMTSAVLSQAYGPRPTDGLVVGDVIIAGGVEITLTSVDADGVTVGFASTTVTASAGDPVYLKAQTPSMSTFREPFYMGGTLVGVAADSASADTAAASRSTAIPAYELDVTLKNNLLDAPASGYMGPAALLNQVKEGQLTLKRIFSDPSQFEKWLDNVKQAVTIIATGRFIKSDFSTSEKLTVKLHNTKLLTNEEPLEVGSYIFDNQSFEVLYDSSDAKAVEVTLVNHIAGTGL